MPDKVTLTQFLLTRIAEDEAPTWTLVPYDHPARAEAGWVGSLCRYCDHSPVYGGTVEAMTESAEEHAEKIHQHSRVLAECEAKRRIVSLFATTLADEMDAAVGKWNETAWKGTQAIRTLALPYADHPDYRDEWKP